MVEREIVQAKGHVGTGTYCLKLLLFMISAQLTQQLKICQTDSNSKHKMLTGEDHRQTYHTQTTLIGEQINKCSIRIYGPVLIYDI